MVAGAVRAAGLQRVPLGSAPRTTQPGAEADQEPGEATGATDYELALNDRDGELVEEPRPAEQESAAGPGREAARPAVLAPGEVAADRDEAIIAGRGPAEGPDGPRVVGGVRDLIPVSERSGDDHEVCPGVELKGQGKVAAVAGPDVESEVGERTVKSGGVAGKSSEAGGAVDPRLERPSSWHGVVDRPEVK
jgi:hypothetical protein